MNEDEYTETRLDTLRWWWLLKWWTFRSWLHRCPECSTRPDRHWGNFGPRWEDDKVARMLGIGRYGCRRCGHGAIAERDALNRLLRAIEEVGE